MEALTAIDVNTGRFVGKRNLEDTITQTNLEAARAVAISPLRPGVFCRLPARAGSGCRPIQAW